MNKQSKINADDAGAMKTPEDYGVFDPANSPTGQSVYLEPLTTKQKRSDEGNGFVYRTNATSHDDIAEIQMTADVIANFEKGAKLTPISPNGGIELRFEDPDKIGYFRRLHPDEERIIVTVKNPALYSQSGKASWRDDKEIIRTYLEERGHLLSQKAGWFNEAGDRLVPSRKMPNDVRDAMKKFFDNEPKNAILIHERNKALRRKYSEERKMTETVGKMYSFRHRFPSIFKDAYPDFFKVLGVLG